MVFHHLFVQFERIAATNPTAKAVLSAQSELSYGQLNEAANTLAFAIDEHIQAKLSTVFSQINLFDTATRQTLMTNKNQLPAPVLIAYEQSDIASIVCLLAVMKLGLPFILYDPNEISKTSLASNSTGPTHDPNASPLFKQIIKDLSPGLIIGSPSFLNSIRAGQTPNSLFPYQISVQNNKVIANSHKALTPRVENLDRHYHPNRIGYYVFTSGSSGEPKAMVHTYGGLAVRINSILEDMINKGLKDNSKKPLDENDCILQFCPLRFDACLAEMFYALLSGASLRLLDNPDARDLLPYYSNPTKKSPSVVVLTPAVYQNLTASGKPEVSALLQHWRVLLTTGDQAQEDAINFIYNCKPQILVINGYGPTEIQIGSSCGIHQAKLPISIDGVAVKGVRSELIAINPEEITNAQVRDLFIEKSKTGKKSGEIVIYEQPYLVEWESKSYQLLSLTLGYVRNRTLASDLIQKRFAINGQGEFYYQTGDLAVDHSGTHREFIGRKDQQVQILGRRIELAPIENALKTILEQKKITDLSFVVKKGQNERIMVSFTLATDSELNEKTLKEIIQELPPSLEVNTKIAFYYIHHGQQELIDIDDREEISSTNRYETILRKLFAEVLKISPDKIHRNSHFTYLGGDSLNFILLAKRMMSEFGLTSFPANFEPKVLKEIAKFIFLTKLYMKCFKISDSKKQDKQKLFFLYPISGDSNVFRIGTGRDVTILPDLIGANAYLLDSPTYNSNFPEFSDETLLFPHEYNPATIEEQGFYIAHAIKQIQTTGNYAIYGWSYGGRLLYWTATTLQKIIGPDQELKLFFLEPMRPDYHCFTDEVSMHPLPTLRGKNLILTNILLKTVNKLLEFNGEIALAVNRTMVDAADDDPLPDFQERFINKYGIDASSLVEQTREAKMKIDELFEKVCLGLTMCLADNLESYLSRFSSTRNTILELLTEPTTPLPLQLPCFVYLSEDLSPLERSRIQHILPKATVTIVPRTDHFTLITDPMVVNDIRLRVVGSNLRDAAQNEDNLPEYPSYLYRREKDFAHVQARMTLKPEHTVNQIIIWGPPGVGKTQFVIDLIHNSEKCCFWFDCHSIDKQYLLFAEKNKLSIGQSQHDTIASVRGYFESQQDWLIVFDGVPDVDTIRNYFPKRGGIILATTQDHAIAPTDGYELLDLDVNEACTLATKYAGNSVSLAAMSKLVTTLQRHPLSIAQALIYIQSNSPHSIKDSDIDNFLTSYSNLQSAKWVTFEYHRNLAQRNNARYQHTIWDTTRIMLDGLTSSLEAIRILELCSYIGPQDIPIEIFGIDENSVKAHLQKLSSLVKYSTQPTGTQISFHGSFHLGIQVWMVAKKQHAYINHLLKFFLDQVKDYVYHTPTTHTGIIKYYSHIGTFIKNYLQFYQVYQVSQTDPDFLTLVSIFIDYAVRVRMNYQDADEIAQQEYPTFLHNEEKYLVEYLHLSIMMAYSCLRKLTIENKTNHTQNLENFKTFARTVIETYDSHLAKNKRFPVNLANDVNNLRSHLSYVSGEVRINSWEGAAIANFLNPNRQNFLRFSQQAAWSYKGQSDEYKLRALLGLAEHLSGNEQAAMEVFASLISPTDNSGPTIHPQMIRDAQTLVVLASNADRPITLPQSKPTPLFNLMSLFASSLQTGDRALRTEFFDTLYHDLGRLIMLISEKLDPKKFLQRYSENILDCFTKIKTTPHFKYDHARYLLLISRFEESFAILKKICEDGIPATSITRYLIESPFAEQPIQQDLQKGSQTIPLSILIAYALTELHANLNPESKKSCEKLLNTSNLNVTDANQATKIFIDIIKKSSAYAEAKKTVSIAHLLTGGRPAAPAVTSDDLTLMLLKGVGRPT